MTKISMDPNIVYILVIFFILVSFVTIIVFAPGWWKLTALLLTSIKVRA